MIQSSLLTFEDLATKKQGKTHNVSQIEVLTAEISPEASNSLRNEDIRRKEVNRLRKLRDQYVEVARKSTDGREARFAAMFVESLRPILEMEGVS